MKLRKIKIVLGVVERQAIEKPNPTIQSPAFDIVSEGFGWRPRRTRKKKKKTVSRKWVAELVGDILAQRLWKQENWADLAVDAAVKKLEEQGIYVRQEDKSNE